MKAITETSVATLKSLGGRPQVLCSLIDSIGGVMLLADDDGRVICYGSDSHKRFAGREIVVRMTAERILITCEGAESIEIKKHAPL